MMQHSRYDYLNVIRVLVMIGFVFMGDQICRSQDIVISNAKLKVKKDFAIITYNFPVKHHGGLFDVSVTITDPDGNSIINRALSGDLGKYVLGGAGKVIFWDLNIDRLLISKDLSIKIQASPSSEEKTEQDMLDQDTVLTDIPAEPNLKSANTSTIPGNALLEREENMSIPGRSISRAGVILPSFLLPGVGLSIYQGEPHWLRGMLGYGCLAGAVVYYLKAVETYDSYLNAFTVNEAKKYLAQSKEHDDKSEYFGYAAAGIWAIDFIWNLAGSRELSKKRSSENLNKLSLVQGYDPVSDIPLIGISYRF